MAARFKLTALAALLALPALAGPAASLPAHAQGASFQVGAAVVPFDPPCGVDVLAHPALQAATNCTMPPTTGYNDFAECAPQLDGTYNGPRRFAFEEPYVDEGGQFGGTPTGHYDLGDPYLDCNDDGRWDGNFIGGGSNTPRYYSNVADQLGARAMVVGNGTKTIAVEVLDHEGAFNVYMDQIRAVVMAQLPSLGGNAPCAGLDRANVFISATHDESAPDSLGLYGVSAPNSPASVTSSVNKYWVDWFETQSATAVINACRNLQSAEITYGQAIEPANLRQCFSSYPFVDDQLMPSLMAVSTATGRVIVSLADVSQHTETLGFNGGSQVDPADPSLRTLDAQKQWLTADWPYWFRTKLETDLGGVAIEMAGSVGSNETPAVLSLPLSRRPEAFLDPGHPAGCRTTYADHGTLTPLGYYSETRSLGQQLAAAVESALGAGTVSASNDIQGQRSSVCVTITNAVFAIGGVAGIFSARQSYSDPNCTVAAPAPPTGQAAGTSAKSTIAAFRIGDGTFVSIPGEVFPFTYLRSFLGPQDMPCPNPNSGGSCNGPASPNVSCAQGNPYALPPWLLPHMHTPYRFIDGEGEDMIGYIFPCGNGVGVPGEYPNDPTGSGNELFGCGHSDDSESAGSSTANVVGNAAVIALDTLEGTTQAPEDIQVGRYLLPGNIASRNPQGTPNSIKCDLDKLFLPAGPAVAVQLQNGTVITPTFWMDLGGRAQGVPDRNTRGWIDAHGTRHWLDVFPDIAPQASVPEAPAAVFLLLAALIGLGVLRGRRILTTLYRSRADKD